MTNEEQNVQKQIFALFAPHLQFVAFFCKFLLKQKWNQREKKREVKGTSSVCVKGIEMFQIELPVSFLVLSLFLFCCQWSLFSSISCVPRSSLLSVLQPQQQDEDS
jgi:ABC-type multidrug transport system permease subunit